VVQGGADGRATVAGQVDAALQPPLGRANSYPPVVSAAFLRQRLDAITVG
jgi:hypothetical protein